MSTTATTTASAAPETIRVMTRRSIEDGILGA
jgi:hypothetical protein